MGKEYFRITGRKQLSGTVTAPGSKNAALPILAASILADGPVTLVNVPRVGDVTMLLEILGELGIRVQEQPLENRTSRSRMLRLEAIDSAPTRADYRLVHRMRAGFCVLGPLLASRGHAEVALPGGCNLGDRPVDLHLKGLAAMGARIDVFGGYVVAEAKRLRGAIVDLAGRRGPTVTGTANVLSAAVLAEGATTIQGAATEPEIVDLGRFLIAMGAQIEGLGTSTIRIQGVHNLDQPTEPYRIIPDRIATATLLLAGAITDGCVTVQGAEPEHLQAFTQVIREIGHQVAVEGDSITLDARETHTTPANRRHHPIHLETEPYPGLPTDLQPQLAALLAVIPGAHILRDTVFPQRVSHLGELARLRAELAFDGEKTIIRGVERLSGATVAAPDLRAGAALVLAGLAASGETIVEGIEHIDRGYWKLEADLGELGAEIRRALW